MKKPRLVTIFSLILILAGLGLTAYPIISNILAQKNASEAIEDYDDQIQDMDEEKIDAVKESMKQYNQQLQKLPETITIQTQMVPTQRAAPIRP